MIFILNILLILIFIIISLIDFDNHSHFQPLQ